jgi:hypothetical protein
VRAGDDAFEAHHAHALTAFARLGLKHDTELARRNAGQSHQCWAYAGVPSRGLSRPFR